jgi:diaminohydroxyphosphoribosylaminopyrimidine deaminase/5-amino-6-(5-phosphoribosylamino)uracil reductase
MAEQHAYERVKDIYYMKRALELAEKGSGRTNPNPLVGAVIVKDGRIIGEGWHEKYGHAHAEVNAVNSSAESVLIREKVKRVVIGTLDPNPLIAGKGAERLKEAGIETTVGVLEQECRRLNEVFFHFIQKRRPFVVLKAAMSLDGKIAAPSGESRWITGEAARRDVQLLRNRYSAVMTGVGTVIQDDPELTCRMEGGRDPLKVILDSGLRIPPGSRVLADQQKNPTLIACTERAAPEKADRLKALGTELLYCSSRNGRIDLEDLMERLGGRGVDSVLLEGGSAGNDSAVSQRIVDKIILYVAPKIIGGEKSKTAVGGQGIGSLDQAYPMRIDSMERVGEDIKITAYRKEGTGICLQE